ncbi:hypothetical protein PQX77_007847 [Marasmius sp. AFHP31]|nr:hypothetical protein PQX77_007847 [Marasmius sp. AFHP31]
MGIQLTVSPRSVRAITLIAVFILPVAQCFGIGTIPVTGVAGAKISVSYSRGLPEEPADIVFVWLRMPKGDPRPTSRTLNGTSPLSGVIEVECPDPGKWELAAFESPFSSEAKLLFAREEEIEVTEPSGSNAPSNSVTTTSTETHTSVPNSGIPPPISSPTSRTTPSPGSSSTTAERWANPSSRRNLRIQSTFVLPRSQPHDAPQNHSSTPAPVAPIVGGIIGGALAVALILFVLRCRLRRRRFQAQGSLNIEPFPTHPSEPKVSPPGSDNTTPQQHTGTNQDDIAARYTYRDPDAKVERQPLVHLQYAEDTSTTPAVQNGLDGTNVAPATFPRPGIEVFTTDELAFALNQRLQEEGRWEIDESLPGYPDSDQGRSC